MRFFWQRLKELFDPDFMFVIARHESDLKAIKRDYYKNMSDVLDTAQQVSSGFDKLAADVSSALTLSNDKYMSVKGSLDAANSALTELQRNGRSEDQVALQTLRNELDNIGVNNNDEQAKTVLNNLLLRMNSLDETVNGSGTVDPVPPSDPVVSLVETP